MNYKVILTYDKEYDGYVVEVPSLPGCMSQGKTEEEALNNIKEAIVGYLEVLKKHNEPIPSIMNELHIKEVII